MLKSFYDRVLDYPKFSLFLVVLLTGFLAWEAQYLEIDASSETLTLEDDQDLRYTREINQRYDSGEFLVITFSPKGEILAEETLNVIRNLSEDLLKIKGVTSVTSVLNVPLLQSPPKPVKELLKSIPTLESEGVDKELAKQEFINSPIYRNLLVSPDFKTTALQVNLVEDPLWRAFINRRYALKEKLRAEGLSETEKLELAQIQVDFKIHRDKVRAEQHQIILDVRSTVERYRGEGELFLGGVTMIADDLISFIKNDLRIFGAGVLVCLIITLWVIFRQLRWILLPVLTCAFSVTATSGFLGLFKWEVTVISSNFISLQIIITMALTIHLIVRYRELYQITPDADQRTLVAATVNSMFKPCAFMVLTTMAGFCSLLLSGILPVINFGWMMSAGIGISLLLTFMLFPVLMIHLPKQPPNLSFENRFRVTIFLANLTEHRGKGIILTSGVTLILCVAGASQLMVENSFIDYFKKSTEIYQGMKVIDQQLGGTTPLDVIIDFPKAEEAPVLADSTEVEEGDDDFDQFEEEFEAEASDAQYWFTADKMDEVERVHNYLDQLDETGKVLSLGTMLKVGETLNDGKKLDNFLLALIYKELPDRFKKIVLNPFVSVEDNQTRFYIRVRDSDPDLRRNEFLKKIRRELSSELNIAPERIHLASLLVLYNNMLQSLFHSQILTLGAVIGVLMVMFLILFRSIKISLIAILPNILSVGVVLGVMGWLKIPLDMMTITIAAISVGIAVDDTIHYIHRFKLEFEKDQNYIQAMHRSHASIGFAMYYTSVTIIMGFSILVLSNFIPSIYFGLLTGLAMVIALLAALTLLPQLLIWLKPFGAESETAA